MRQRCYATPRVVVSLTALFAAFASAGCFVETDDDGVDVIDPGSGLLGPYDVCDFSSDCDPFFSDACFDINGGGMCTLSCASDADCPGVGSFSGACYALAFDPSGAQLCYQRCFDDIDCAPGLFCADATIGGGVVDAICVPGSAVGPTPIAAAYEECSFDADCETGAFCATISTDAGIGDMCTFSCASDFDCPGANGYAGACYTLFGDPSGAAVCYARCDFDDDCPLGFRCVTATMGGVATDAICLPG